MSKSEKKNSGDEDIDDLIGKLFYSHIEGQEWNNEPEIKSTAIRHEKRKGKKQMREGKGRMINKNISDSDGFASLSAHAAVLFCMLIPHFNSHGKMNGGTGYIKDEVCPKIPYLDADSIPKLLTEISEKTNVKYFSANGRHWLQSIYFLTKHQTLRTDRMGNDDLPNYPGVVLDKSGISPVQVQELGDTTESVNLQGDIQKHSQVLDKSGISPVQVPLEVEVKVKSKSKSKAAKTPLTNLPPDFNISERVIRWASEKGYTNLPEHLESFKRKALAKSYQYADWDSAFMEAVRENWAKLKNTGTDTPKPKDAAGREMKYV